ncbi:hypothetical protein [Mobilicoccus caccae]|uniref:Uncharacterized protein n=1 Tax=Mobilicoccus caccae TaxID=1859295 RepID=A0ABQ6IS56_9MICO|nr:hypothetical protein [Mobilicoccus caccae]GMA40760.1 hypothetical protein GCM10025883_28050 [Mobilicoccus caccae]
MSIISSGSARGLRVAAVASGLALAGSLGVAGPAAHAAPGDHDLAVSYSVSSLKAEGAAGLVAINLKNVGSQRYFAEYPIIGFDVKVVTVKGPEGVDRVITPSSANGAHVRDLGFDTATSTRTFRYTLANPINAKQKAYLGTLSFGDGLTSEGRLVQKIVTTQLTHLEGETPGANDQNVDSTQNGNTVSDFGSTKTVTGRF